MRVSYRLRHLTQQTETLARVLHVAELDLDRRGSAPSGYWRSA